MANDFPFTINLLTVIRFICCETKRIHEASERKNRKAWHKDETDSQVWLDEPSIKVMEILIIFFESIHTGHFDLGSE